MSAWAIDDAFVATGTAAREYLSVCGIFGFAVNNGVAPGAAAGLLETGMSRIRHRGPDGEGTWTSPCGQVGFGHLRLSIIDVDTGAQPMESANGRYTIIFNGEIYNYLELRGELGEASFRTQSDTEVIIRAFERWGTDCFARFRGMFALVIWDNAEQKLILARDRFGIKPLYWARNGNTLYFGSEIKALQPFLADRSINFAALSDYFTFQFCLGAKTMLAGISQFPPASFAVVRPGGKVSPEKYWEVEYRVDYDHTEAWFSERLRALVDDSVSMHLRADVEVASYVSGGVDSSLLASLARDQRTAGRFMGFNGRFSDGPGFDESHYAQALAEQSSLDLRVVDIGEQDFVDNISEVIWHLDQPTAGPGAFPQYMVSREAGRHVKVVLGGQGGDEIFGGYARYLVAYFEQCVKGAIEGTLDNGNFVVTYESIIPNLETLRQYKPMLKEFWADGLFGPRDERYFRLINRANTYGGIIAPGAIDPAATFAEFKEIFWGSNVGKESYFDSMTHFDFKTLLPALLHVEDRMSMAHGVEARVPFLDHPLVEFAATVPADVKFKNGELKRLLKTVFGPSLPREINERKDKMGFPVPLNLWLGRGGVAREFVADTLSSTRAQQRFYLEDGLPLDRVLDRESPYGRNVWALLSLELWQQQFVDAA